MSFELGGCRLLAELVSRGAVGSLKQPARAINQFDLVEALGVGHFRLIVVSLALLAAIAASDANRLFRSVIEAFNVLFKLL